MKGLLATTSLAALLAFGAAPQARADAPASLVAAAKKEGQ